jgi:HAD superfamily hydrolase (TIGR01549 family)
MAALKAITFDLWDTIVIDDSDEAVRAARGLRSKRDERRFLVWEALNSLSPIDLALVTLAYDVADAAFNRVWHDQHVTWPIGERLDVIFKGLKRELPEKTWNKLVADHESMEVEIPPRLIEGCDEAIAELAKKYKLAIVSDAIVTPGSGLRQLLEKHGVLKYFQGFAFSDEVGYSKPHRKMFTTAGEQLGVELDEMVHIGDRDHNDIQGAHQHGLQAVLFTAARDVDKARSRPDAHCDNYRDLPSIIDRLASSRG